MEQTNYSSIRAHGNARQQNGHIYNNTAGHSASGEARQHIGNVTNNTTYTYTLRKRRSDDTLRQNERSQTLLTAAAEGQRPRVNYLLSRGVDIDWSDEEGFTALHHACFSGFEDVVQILLEAGADVNAQSLDVGTPLCLAALRGRENVVEMLIEYRASVYKAGLWVGTPLHCACYIGSIEVSTLLLDNGARLNVSSTVQRRYMQNGSTANPANAYSRAVDTDGDRRHVVTCDAFYLAAREGHQTLVIYLLQSGQDVDSLNRTWETNSPTRDTFEDVAEQQRVSGSTALMRASHRGHVRIVATHISQGANVDLKDSRGSCALAYAASAAYGECFDCLRLLIDAGADANSRDEYLRTLLWHATGPRRIDITDLLLQNGADINAVDINGLTPCHHCVEQDDIMKLRVLLTYKPDLDKRDKYGHTALYKAIYLDARLGMVACLLEAGANPSAPNGMFTPLHLAVHQGRIEIVRALLTAGASTVLKDHRGRIPADLSERNSKIHNLLMSAATSRSGASYPTNNHNFCKVEAALDGSSNEQAYKDMLEQYNQLQQQTMFENKKMQRAQAFYGPLESMSKRDATS